MLLRIGAAIVLVIAMLAIAGPVLTRSDPSAQNLPLRLEGPSLAHPFGLDELGRDVFARMLVGARISFLVGLVVVGVSSIVGTLLGAVAGYFGGWIDDVIGRATDILMAFPGLLLAIALVAVLGPSLANALLALTVIGWVGFARLARGQVLRSREFEYVQAARAVAARRAVDHSGAGRAGDARHGRCRTQRSGAQFSRIGRPAADAKLGSDAERRPCAFARRSAPHGVPGTGDRAARARLQLSRRRPARSYRSEAAARGSFNRRARLSRSPLSGSAPSSIAFCSHRAADTGSSRRIDNVAMRCARFAA